MNLCRSIAMKATVYEEKKTVIAGDVRTILHKIQVLVPKGQYFVKTPNKVIGMVSKQRAESATANVAIKILRAVFISENEKNESESFLDPINQGQMVYFGLQG